MHSMRRAPCPTDAGRGAGERCARGAVGAGPDAAQPGSAIRLPALGDAAGEDFTVGTERRLGDQIMAELRRDPDYLDDPLLLDYLQSLWAPLLAAARLRGDITADTDTALAWETFLVRDRSVNAFALPGGFVGVHLGLIAMTTSRDELASVLAHELSHVTQRHIARSIASSSRQSLVGMAATAARRAGRQPQRQRRRDAGRDRRQPGGDGAGPAQFLARHGARGRPHRLGRAPAAPVSRRSAWPRCSRSSNNASRLNDNGAYPVPALAPADGRAHRRGAHARRSRRRATQRRSVAARPPADAGPRPRADGQRRAGTAPPAGAGRGEHRPPRRPNVLARLYASALASLQLRDAARAQAAVEAALPLASSAAPGDARAGRALDAVAGAGAASQRPGAARAGRLLDARVDAADAAGGAARPMLLARAQAALDAARGRRRCRSAARQHRGAADLGRGAARRRHGVGAAGAMRRRARAAPALAARRRPKRALRSATSVAPSTACAQRSVRRAAAMPRRTSSKRRSSTRACAT